MSLPLPTPFSLTTKALGEDEKDRRHARLDPQLAVDMLQVLLYRPGAHAEDESDLGIGLATGQPAEHLGLSRGEAQELAKRLLSQHPGIRHPLRPALLTPLTFRRPSGRPASSLHPHSIASLASPFDSVPATPSSRVCAISAKAGCEVLLDLGLRVV